MSARSLVPASWVTLELVQCVRIATSVPVNVEEIPAHFHPVECVTTPLGRIRVLATRVIKEKELFARTAMSARANAAEVSVLLSGRLVPTPLDLLLAVAILALAGMESLALV